MRAAQALACARASKDGRPRSCRNTGHHPSRLARSQACASCLDLPTCSHLRVTAVESARLKSSALAKFQIRQLLLYAGNVLPRILLEAGEALRQVQHRE